MSAFTKYTKSDLMKDYFEYSASLSISKNDYETLKDEELWEYFVGTLEEAKVTKTTHFWDYKYLANSWV